MSNESGNDPSVIRLAAAEQIKALRNETGCGMLEAARVIRTHLPEDYQHCLANYGLAIYRPNLPAGHCTCGRAKLSK